MATTYALTGDLANLIGASFDSIVRVTVKTNVQSGVIVDAAGNKIRLGGASIKLTNTTAFSMDLLETDGATNPTAFQYEVVVEYVDASTRKRTTWSSGPFSHTAAQDLADIIESQWVPPTYLTAVTATLDAKLAEAEAAKVGAEVAKTGAETARDEAVAIVIADVEGAMAAAVDAPGPFKDSLSASIDAAIAAASTPRTTGTVQASNRLASLADFAVGDLILGVAGDSTLNDGNDMPRKFLMLYADEIPANLRITEKQWVDSTQNYPNPEVVIKAGEVTPAVGGTVLSDNFNRTAAELSGSTSSGGQVWAGPAGAWSADGSKATSAGTTALMFDTGSKDQTGSMVGEVVTTAPASQRVFRVTVASTTSGPTSGGNYVWAQFAITTSGTVAFSLWKRIAGVNTQIGSTLTAVGLTAASATPQGFAIEVSTAIQNVSATITVAGTPYTIDGPGALTEGDVSALGSFGGISGANLGTAITVDSVELATPYTPASSDGITVYNGAVGGTRITYQTSRIAALYPVAPHVVLVGNGHNYGTDDPATFIADIDAFVTALHAVYPETMPLFTSQNPQHAPAATIAAHAARQAALRDWCLDKGYEYLPAFEGFASLADGGLAYTMSDGIHPTYPAFGSTADSGVVFWARLLLARVRASRYVPTV